MIWQVIMMIPGIFTDLRAFSQTHFFFQRASSLMLQLEGIGRPLEAPKASSYKGIIFIKASCLAQLRRHLL